MRKVRTDEVSGKMERELDGLNELRPINITKVMLYLKTFKYLFILPYSFH